MTKDYCDCKDNTMRNKILIALVAIFILSAAVTGWLISRDSDLDAPAFVPVSPSATAYVEGEVFADSFGKTFTFIDGLQITVSSVHPGTVSEIPEFTVKVTAPNGWIADDSAVFSYIDSSMNIVTEIGIVDGAPLMENMAPGESKTYIMQVNTNDFSGSVQLSSEAAVLAQWSK